MNAILTSFIQCDLEVWWQNTIKLHLIVLIAECLNADVANSLIFEEGLIGYSEMAVRSYHSTRRKIPKITGLIDIAAEAWHQERVYFEFCGKKLVLVQNLV